MLKYQRAAQTLNDSCVWFKADLGFQNKSLESLYGIGMKLPCYAFMWLCTNQFRDQLGTCVSYAGILCADTSLSWGCRLEVSGSLKASFLKAGGNPKESRWGNKKETLFHCCRVLRGSFIFIKFYIFPSSAYVFFFFLHPAIWQTTNLQPGTKLNSRASKGVVGCFFNYLQKGFEALALLYSEWTGDMSVWIKPSPQTVSHNLSKL